MKRGKRIKIKGLGHIANEVRKNKIVPKEKRIEVYERSGGVCEYCDKARADAVHHIKHRSQGGGNEMENLIHLCFDCHHKAHTDVPTMKLFRECGCYSQIPKP